MTDESDARNKVADYLRGLGFVESMVTTHIPTSGDQEIDFVIYRPDRKALAIVEVKSGSKDYPRSRDSKLRFHPYVRQAQFLADQIKAPYYLLSDGKSFFWFMTDSSGWPRLLEEPINPATPADIVGEGTSKEELVRSLQELQQFVFWRGGEARSEETAIVILAKLLKEAGHDGLFETIRDSLWSQLSLPFFSEPGISAILSEVLKPRKTGRNLSDALKVIEHLNFTNTNSKVVLTAFDETILRYQPDGAPWRINRWLADLMARLARPSKQGLVLDLSASFGDVLAGIQISFPKTQLAGITSSPLSAIWAKIQQLVLKNTDETILKGSVIPKEVMNANIFNPPNCIVTAPSFGGKTHDSMFESNLHWAGVRHIEDLILELALDWIAPGGRVVMLVPEGLLFSSGKRLLTRQFLLNHSCLRGVISLSPGLLSSTSALKTSLLIFEKDQPNSYPTFFASLESFKHSNTFDSREIPSVKLVLDEFEKYEKDSSTYIGSKTRVISGNLLDPNDLTAGNYLSDSTGSRQTSEYPLVSLEDISKKMLRGKSIRLRERGDAPVIGPAMIRSLDLDRSALKKTNFSELPLNAPSVEPGDILLNLIGTHLGEAAMVGEDLAGSFISGHVALVRPDTASVFPEYLAIALNGQVVKTQIGQLFTGSLIRGLPLNRLKKLVIPLPDLNTQNQIVYAVTRAREKLEQVRKSASTLEADYLELVQSVTSEGVTE